MFQSINLKLKMFETSLILPKTNNLSRCCTSKQMLNVGNIKSSNQMSKTVFLNSKWSVLTKFWNLYNK